MKQKHLFLACNTSTTLYPLFALLCGSGHDTVGHYHKCLVRTNDSSLIYYMLHVYSITQMKGLGAKGPFMQI